MANMFDYNGQYNKTEWKPGDRITAGKLNKIEESLEAINNNDIERHKEADERLDALEEQKEAVEERFDELEDLVADNKTEVDVAIYENNVKMDRLEQEMNDGIEEVHNVASTVDGKIADADASMKAQVDRGKADMEAMVAEVEGELDSINLQLEHIEISPFQFGAKCDGVTDDSIAIRNSIAFLNSIGGGVLNLGNNNTYNLATLSGYTFVKMYSNIKIKGESTLKVKDGIGDYYSIFNIFNCSNIEFTGFTIDENTKYNLPTSDTGTGSNIRTTFAGWAGDSKCYNVTFDGITINNCIGVWQITLGDATFKDFNNVRIKNCAINYYNDEELNLTYDRTCIYLGVKNSKIENCIINGGVNANTAIEFHGSNIRATDNIINNFLHGFFLVNELENVDDVKNLIVENNYVNTSRFGILLWFTYANSNVDVVSITNNNIIHGQTGIGLYPIIGNSCVFKNIQIINNNIISDNKSLNNCGLRFDGSANESIFENLTIRENTISGESDFLFRLTTEPQPNAIFYKNVNIESNLFKSLDSQGIFIINRGVDVYKKIVFINNKFDVDNNFSINVAGGDADIMFKDNFYNNLTLATFTGNGKRCVREICSNDIYISSTLTDSIKNRFKPSSFIGGNVKLNVHDLNDDIYITNTGIVYSIPKHIYLGEGSKIYTIEGSKEYVCTKSGYIADHDIETGEHKAKEWVKCGLYVWQCVVDNNDTDPTSTSGNFTYIGESAVLS